MTRYVPKVTCLAIIGRNVYATSPAAGLTVESITCKSGGRAFLADGSAADPSMLFSSGNGLWRSGASTLELATGGIGQLQVGSTLASLTSSITLGATTVSSNISTGALVVYGGAGIAKNVNVTGSAITAAVSGVSQLQLGDTIATGYNFASDTDTAIYRVGSDQLGIATNNANKFTLTTSSATIASTILTLTVNSTTDSSSTSTGSIVTAGGITVGGNMNVGLNMTAQAVGSANIVVTSLGSAASPAFTFTGYTTSGLYFVSTLYPGLSVGGSLVFGESFTEGTSITCGKGSTNGGTSFSTAVGLNAICYNNYCTAIGYGAQARGNGSIAIGKSAEAAWSSGTYATVIGQNARSAYGNSVIIGYQVTSTRTNDVAIGYNISSTNDGMVSLGDSGYGTSWLTIGTTTWGSSSDEQLKTDITDLQVGMELIRRIQPITFKWCQGHGDTSLTHQGFSYQRLRRALTDLGYDKHEAVDLRDPDGYGSVAPTGLLPHIVRAIEELAAKLDSNEARVNKKLEAIR